MDILSADPSALGSVSVSPPGSSCQQLSPGTYIQCGEYAYPEDTVVTLTAVPDSGSRFVEWSGACAGTVGPVCTLTMTQAQGDTVAGALFRGLADLSLEKTDSADPVGRARTLVYTLTVTNAGPLQATNVTVTDTLPASLPFASMSAGCSRVGQAITCVAATIDVELQRRVHHRGDGGHGRHPVRHQHGDRAADQADYEPCGRHGIADDGGSPATR